jgi:hypothetical protein
MEVTTDRARERLQKRIIDTVSDYYRTWELPYSYDMLARSYGLLARAVMGDGGSLEDLLRDMHSNSELIFTQTPRCKKVILPHNEKTSDLVEKDLLLDVLMNYDTSSVLRRRAAKVKT